MQQLTYAKKRALEWREAPEPTLHSPKAAIVRPFVAARCDADGLPLFHNLTTPMKLALAIHYLDPLVRDMLGNDPFRGPYPFGHECVAEVVECGGDVKNVKRGDRVIVPWAISYGWYRKHAPRRSGPYLIGVDASASIAGLNYALPRLSPECRWPVHSRLTGPLSALYVGPKDEPALAPLTVAHC